jgi:hypothetical protein
MRRVQFIEFHEQPWLPSSIRDEITDALQFGLNISKAYAPVVPVLQSALDSVRSQADDGQRPVGQSGAGHRVVDLCSGGGGPWFDICRELKPRNPQVDSSAVQIWLTDKHPNFKAIQNVPAALGKRIHFYPGAVEATNVPGELKGFRTMFTSFHHFPPEEAGTVLQNAVDAGEGIGIFEITRRAPSAVVLMFGWVLMLLVCIPWIRPFRWSRLFWTYLVPIIPLVLLLDGAVSCLRTYRLEELGEIVEKLGANNYEWKIGELSRPGGMMPVTYLVGYPRVSVAEIRPVTLRHSDAF